MSIELIVGPMFAGKSTELFKRLNRYRYAGKTTVLFKYAKDTRYDMTLACSHDNVKQSAISVENLLNVELPQEDVIGIDEGQFLSGLTEWVHRAANAGKIVVISALDSNFLMKPWPNITPELFAISEKITKMHAVCVRCKGDAAFTKRTVDVDILELIGGAESYVSSCRKCFLL